MANYAKIRFRIRVTSFNDVVDFLCLERLYRPMGRYAYTQIHPPYVHNLLNLSLYL